MIRCILQRTCLAAARPSCATHLAGPAAQCHKFVCTIQRQINTKANKRARKPPYTVFSRFPRPLKDDIPAWTALLDRGLPTHLRQHDVGDDEHLDANDVAELLIAAQVYDSSGVDLLFHLGFHEGRWTAVVWLVKKVVDAFSGPRPYQSRLSRTLLSPWTNKSPLRKITENPIDLAPRQGRDRELHRAIPTEESLASLTDDLKPERYGRRFRLQHSALGQIWRTIGNMTIACADGEIKPEILEIIAYLHHKDFMPTSIYNFKPSGEATAIQQPPMLNILSSRILTSLSDAAWRAHEKMIVEEAKARGGNYDSLRPEVPGAVFRVNVAGLRPEVWLELILWSALHGGWVAEGMAILQTMSSEPEPRQWKPLSWRSLLSTNDQTDLDWERLDYHYNTQRSSTRDKNSSGPTASIANTISSEVVNAYADALLSIIRVGVGERGISPARALNSLIVLRDFLQRSKLTLSAGSWDAIVLRYIDIHESAIDGMEDLKKLLSLSPVMGGELNDRTLHDLPPYIFDGSAAVIGLYHQALRSRIAKGDVKGSLRIFRWLQDHADRNKRKSALDFFKNQRGALSEAYPEDNGLFTSNYPGIEYAAFDMQIPPIILGPFLELVMDAKAYEFGRWLLNGDEIDEPLITKMMYKDPAITPAIIRFATETRDQEMLGKVISPYRVGGNIEQRKIPNRVLNTFFVGQVALKRWDSAVKVLEHLEVKAPNTILDLSNLAHVARAMLLEISGTQAGNSQSEQDLNHAQQILADMVRGRYDHRERRSLRVRNTISLLLAFLSASDASMARFCLSLQPLSRHYMSGFEEIELFNLVLEGIVAAYGSACGRRVLGLFWPHNIREAQRAGTRWSSDGAYEPIVPRVRPREIDKIKRQRNVVFLPDHLRGKVVLYGGLDPNLRTISIIMERALVEFKQSASHESAAGPARDSSDHAPVVGEPRGLRSVDDSPSGMIAWAARCLRSMRVPPEDIQDKLNETLPRSDLEMLYEQQQSTLDLVTPRTPGSHIEDRESRGHGPIMYSQASLTS